MQVKATCILLHYFTSPQQLQGFPCLAR